MRQNVAYKRSDIHEADLSTKPWDGGAHLNPTSIGLAMYLSQQTK